MAPKIDGIYKPAGDKYKRPFDYHHLFGAKGYTNAQYVEIVTRMGFTDVCECEKPKHQVRFDSGSVGQVECAGCRCLIRPTNYIYPCDECMEPVLSDKFPVMTDDEFLCNECQWETKG